MTDPKGANLQREAIRLLLGPKKEKAADALPQCKAAGLPITYITKIELTRQGQFCGPAGWITSAFSAMMLWLTGVIYFRRSYTGVAQPGVAVLPAAGPHRLEVWHV